MDLVFATDSGHLVCDLDDGVTHVTVMATAPDRAAADFLAAVEEAREHEIAECYWHEPDGDYRWIFRRHGDTFDVAVMWCSGVMTGWQHVFRADCPVDALVKALARRP